MTLNLMQVYTCHSCATRESNRRIPALWESFLDRELRKIHLAIRFLHDIERRDIAEILPATQPDPIPSPHSESSSARCLLPSSTSVRPARSSCPAPRA